MQVIVYKKRFYASMGWLGATEQPKDFAALPIDIYEAKALWDLEPDLNHARVASLLQPYLRARVVLSNIKGWKKNFSQMQGGRSAVVESCDVRLTGVEYSSYPIPRCRAEATFDLLMDPKYLVADRDKLLAEHSGFASALVFYWDFGEGHATSKLDLSIEGHQSVHFGPCAEGFLVGTGMKQRLDEMLERIEDKVLERGLFTDLIGTGFFDLTLRSEWLVGGQVAIVIDFDNRAWPSEAALRFSARNMAKAISYVQAKLEELSFELCDLEANEMLGLVAGWRVEFNSQTMLRMAAKLESSRKLSKLSDGQLAGDLREEANFVISPLRKKSFVETETYEKVVHGKPQNLQIETGWRWGSLTVMAQVEEIRAIDVANAAGFNPEGHFEVDSGESFDGCWSELRLPSGMGKALKHELESLFAEGGVGALEETGWQYVETKTVIYGPLVVKDANGALIAAPSLGIGRPVKTAWLGIGTPPSRQGIYEVSEMGDAWDRLPELLRWDGRVWRNQNGKPLRLAKVALWRGLSECASLHVGHGISGQIKPTRSSFVKTRM